MFGSIPLKFLIPFVSNNWWSSAWQPSLGNIHMVALHPLGPVATIAAMHKSCTFQKEWSSCNNRSFLKIREYKKHNEYNNKYRLKVIKSDKLLALCSPLSSMKIFKNNLKSTQRAYLLLRVRMITLTLWGSLSFREKKVFLFYFSWIIYVIATQLMGSMYT